MPNPNYCEMTLHANYGPDAATLQATEIYAMVSEHSDQLDHKYLRRVSLAGVYVELAHYREVMQVIVQNTSSAAAGLVVWTDDTTGAVASDDVVAGEFISICGPDVLAGINLHAEDAEAETQWHLAICGQRGLA